MNNVKIQMQIWDTAGQERFRAMAPMYYRNTNAALIVYDVTSKDSFSALRSWVEGTSLRVSSDSADGESFQKSGTRSISRSSSA